MNNLLLTGAGFTKNFGGYLAQEIWGYIHNSINSSDYKKLKLKIKEFGETLDFEGFYSEVINDNDFSDKEKKYINRIILNAFISLDKSIHGWIGNSDGVYPISEGLLSRFLNNFKFIFTTNQDLFIEKKILNADIYSPVQGDNTNYRIKLRKKPYSDDLCIKLPSEIKEISTTHPNYIKLHGSSNWLSSDGSDCMVIGAQKDDQIDKEPVLKKFFNLFYQELNKYNSMLVIIGYGFKDKHINEIICEAVSKNNLKICLIQPDGFPSIDRNCIKFENIDWVYKNVLKDIFPADDNSSSKEIRNQLKENLDLRDWIII